MIRPELKEKLDFLVDEYNQPGFIENDPIGVPHRFSNRGDIEISGFLTACIAWGNRLSIIRSANRMIELMDGAPYDFVTNHTESDLARFEGFVHRTFQAADLQYFISSLASIYRRHGGLENAMTKGWNGGDNLKESLSHFKAIFFEHPHLSRTEKHVADPIKGSAAKRLNMFLRWMVRKDDRGVDFGIWNSVPMSVLSIPLDVHTATQARRLGLLQRKQNDWRAVEELDQVLRQMDAHDPVRYDYALFGLGVNA